jgi:hypothetical protein
MISRVDEWIVDEGCDGWTQDACLGAWRWDRDLREKLEKDCGGCWSIVGTGMVARGGVGVGTGLVELVREQEVKWIELGVRMACRPSLGGWIPQCSSPLEEVLLSLKTS